MSKKLTPYIQQIDRPCIPSVEFWELFTAAVRSKLATRGAFDHPPAYYGYEGTDWEGAFDTLAIECLEAVVFEKLHHYHKRLNQDGWKDVEGLVYSNIGRFLTDRQVKYDPQGNAVFSNLVAVLQAGVDAKVLRTQGLRKGRIRNETSITLVNAENCKVVSPEQVEESIGRISEWASCWPQFARQTKDAREILERGIQQLARLGVTGFVFGDLCNSIKRKVRLVQAPDARQVPAVSEVASEHPGGDDDFFRTLDPIAGYWKKDQADWCIRELKAQIAELDRHERVKARLTRIAEERIQILLAGEELPKDVELSRRLGIPTSTISDDLKTLKLLENRILRQSEGQENQPEAG